MISNATEESSIGTVTININEVTEWTQQSLSQ
jgi:hypothetical protein